MSDAPIGNVVAPAFLSPCETRYVSAGGVPLRKAAVSAALTIYRSGGRR